MVYSSLLDGKQRHFLVFLVHVSSGFFLVFLFQAAPAAEGDDVVAKVAIIIRRRHRAVWIVTDGCLLLTLVAAMYVGLQHSISVTSLSNLTESVPPRRK